MKKLINIMIKEKLDEYLEFDSNELFNFKNSLVRVFGGAIRDIIANMPINITLMLFYIVRIKFFQLMLMLKCIIKKEYTLGKINYIIGVG